MTRQSAGEGCVDSTFKLEAHGAISFAVSAVAVANVVAAAAADHQVSIRTSQTRHL